MLAGRLKFSPLFYALNQTYYQEIDYRDWKMRSLCPTTLLTFLNSNESFSVILREAVFTLKLSTRKSSGPFQMELRVRTGGVKHVTTQISYQR